MEITREDTRGLLDLSGRGGEDEKVVVRQGLSGGDAVCILSQQVPRQHPRRDHGKSLPPWPSVRSLSAGASPNFPASAGDAGGAGREAWVGGAGAGPVPGWARRGVAVGPGRRGGTRLEDLRASGMLRCGAVGGLRGELGLRGGEERRGGPSWAGMGGPGGVDPLWAEWQGAGRSPSTRAPGGPEPQGGGPSSGCGRAHL